MMYTLRPMSMYDEDWIVNTVAPYTVENDLKRNDLYNKEQLTKLFHMCLVSGVSFICEREGEPIGVIGGVQHGHVFNPEIPMVTTLFWFVDPQYRNSRAAYVLMKAYLDEIGDIECIFSLQDYSLKKDTFMLKMGFTHGERVFVKRK